MLPSHLPRNSFLYFLHMWRKISPSKEAINSFLCFIATSNVVSAPRTAAMGLMIYLPYFFIASEAVLHVGILEIWVLLGISTTSEQKQTNNDHMWHQAMVFFNVPLLVEQLLWRKSLRFSLKRYVSRKWNMTLICINCGITVLKKVYD